MAAAAGDESSAGGGGVRAAVVMAIRAARADAEGRKDDLLTSLPGEQL